MPKDATAMRGLRVFQPMGFTLPKQNDEELPIGEDGHTRAPDHTRDRMGDFPSVALWNWSQPSTDWFNLATGEALAEYNPSPADRYREAFRPIAHEVLRAEPERFAGVILRDFRPWQSASLRDARCSR